jgi:hypothetical protein
MMEIQNTGKFLRETCFSLPEIWDWDGGSPSSRTMTLSILLKGGINIYARSGFQFFGLISCLFHTQKYFASSKW